MVFQRKSQEKPFLNSRSESRRVTMLAFTAMLSEWRKVLGMPLVNIHQPCDEYMRTGYISAIKASRTEYVSDIVKSIGQYLTISAMLKIRSNEKVWESKQQSRPLDFSGGRRH